MPVMPGVNFIEAIVNGNKALAFEGTTNEIDDVLWQVREVCQCSGFDLTAFTVTLPQENSWRRIAIRYCCNIHDYIINLLPYYYQVIYLYLHAYFCYASTIIFIVLFQYVNKYL